MHLMSLSLGAKQLEALRRDFEIQGYAVVPGLISPSEVEEIREIFDQAAQDGIVPDYFAPVSKAEAEGDPLKMYPRYMHPHRTIRRTQDFLLHPGVMQILEAFFGHEALAVQSMFYYKPPGARGQAMHQDNFYLLAEPHTCVAAWTAIDDIDPENGGMYLVPNTNDLELSCPEVADSQESFTTHLVRTPVGKKAIPCIMKAGDTLFFNGNLLHGSGPNRTKDRFRRSFIGHYVSGVTDRISHFYMPMLTPDGREVRVEANKSGGACGQAWEGAQH